MPSSLTQEEVEVLKQGIRDRRLAAEIAADLGRTKASLLYQAHKLGLKWNWTPEEFSELCSRSARMNPKRATWAWGRKQAAEARRAK